MITEGEIDALTVYQETGRQVLQSDRIAVQNLSHTVREDCCPHLSRGLLRLEWTYLSLTGAYLFPCFVSKQAISLPNGAKSLPPQLIKMLERFDQIYLWLDDDVPGQEVMPGQSLLFFSTLSSLALVHLEYVSSCIVNRETRGMKQTDSNDVPPL